MNVPFPEVEVLLQKYDTEHIHVFHVAHLTLQLFDLTTEWHLLTPRDRDLLHSAALLHDIGWSQTRDGKGHHKLSLQLIDAYPWTLVTPQEKDLIAQIARYHRKSIPVEKHERYSALSFDQQRRLSKMAALLRIGDALDRTHRQIITRIEIVKEKKEWLFLLHANSKIDAEIAMAQEKSNLLKKIAPFQFSFKKTDLQ